MSSHAQETVVLLHGLARSADSMDKMEVALQEAGYETLNINYPSREYPIETLSEHVQALLAEKIKAEHTLHFVTHSMGGIIVRQLYANQDIEKFGRVVMLSPPNQGSEVVDTLGNWKAFKWLNGPAGGQLGTESDGFIASLGPVEFELGVITGDRSINWILSTMIEGKDDGKVSVEHAKVEGMKEFRVVHATHPMIMRRKDTIRFTLHFLEHGSFE